MPSSPCPLSRCISMHNLSIGSSIASVFILPSIVYTLSILYIPPYPYPFVVGQYIIYSHHPLARLSNPSALSIHTFYSWMAPLYILPSISIHFCSIHSLFPSSFGLFIQFFSLSIHPYLLFMDAPPYTFYYPYPFVFAQYIIYSHHPLACLSNPSALVSIHTFYSWMAPLFLFICCRSIHHLF
jgi:hypothetical protein